MSNLWAYITVLLSSWHQAKLLAEHMIAIEHDALHMIAGSLVWLAICLWRRQTIIQWQPLLWTFAIAAWNETVDLWTELWPDAGKQIGEGLKDLLLTMFVPLAIMMAARLAPRLFRLMPPTADRPESQP